METGDQYTLIFSVVPKEPADVAGGAVAGGDGSAAAAPLLSISGKDTQGSAGGGVEVLAVEVLLGSVRLLWARAPEEPEGLSEESEEVESGVSLLISTSLRLTKPLCY